MTEEERARQEDEADDHAYARSPFGGRRRGQQIAGMADREPSFFSTAARLASYRVEVERRYDAGGGGHTPPPLRG